MNKIAQFLFLIIGSLTFTSAIANGNISETGPYDPPKGYTPIPNCEWEKRSIRLNLRSGETQCSAYLYKGSGWWVLSVQTKDKAVIDHGVIEVISTIRADRSGLDDKEPETQVDVRNLRLSEPYSKTQFFWNNSKDLVRIVNIMSVKQGSTEFAVTFHHIDVVKHMIWATGKVQWAMIPQNLASDALEYFDPFIKDKNPQIDRYLGHLFNALPLLIEENKDKASFQAGFAIVFDELVRRYYPSLDPELHAILRTYTILFMGEVYDDIYRYSTPAVFDLPVVD